MNEHVEAPARRGGCQCGAVRYESTGNARALYVCHCHECRKQSASAFGISLVVPASGFRVTKGMPRTWSRPTDSGRVLDCVFCAQCGSRLWHQSRGSGDRLNIKGGSLDEPLDLGAAIHIWTSRKLPGVQLPETAVQFPFEPQGPGP
ncbi:MAG: GFA family protein [Gammaproteobacteria bacterium]|nr:GFA family protein [Gammaproteobacteria bacterium]